MTYSNKIRTSFRHLKIALIILLQVLFLALFLFFLNSPALHAQTTTGTVAVVGVSGASFVSEDFKTIYGGTTATGEASCPLDNGVCNSCIIDLGAGMRPCNEAEITDTTAITLNFVWKGESVTNAKVLLGFTATGQPQSGPLPTYTLTSLTKDAGATYTTTWGRICSALNCAVVAGSCNRCLNGRALNLGVASETDDSIVDSSKSTSIQFKLEHAAVTTLTECAPESPGESGVGPCYFSLFPGDGKLYMDDLTYGSGFPESGRVGFEGFNVYYSEFDFGADPADSLASLTPNSTGEAITVTSATDNDKKILGLVNDTNYCAIAASKSKAGNINNFYPTALMIGPPATVNLDRFCQMPQEVFGVLDGKKCFIATAAFGSELDEHVNRFRDFRDQFLIKSRLGKELTMTYYKFSPTFAGWMDSFPLLKFIVRAGLWVLLAFIEIFMQFGFWMTLAAGIFLLSSTLLAASALTRRLVRLRK